MAVSAPGHINSQLLVLLLGSKTGRFDLQCAAILTSSLKSAAWGRGGDVDPFYKGGKKADQRRSTWLRLPVNQPGARTAAPASGWVSFSLALGKPALLESQRSIPHLPKRRGRKVSLLVHESRRVGISES